MSDEPRAAGVPRQTANLMVWGSTPSSDFYALVAQLEEQQPSKLSVTGSNPVGSTTCPLSVMDALQSSKLSESGSIPTVDT